MTDDDYYSHPIFDTNSFRINTPIIDNLVEKVTRLVWTGATGSNILGYTRAGKTTAIEVIENRIFARNGNQIPVFRYSLPRRDYKTIRALYKSMLSQLKFGYRKSADVEAYVDTLLMRIAETANAAGVKQVIITVDEAQRLSIPQIDVFAELDDYLRKVYKISMITIFIGNREQMSTLLDDVNDGDNQHIKGRFFRQTLHFTGLKSEKDVKACLSEYDTLCYPTDGLTYTQFFCDADYKKRFRMASLSKPIWGVFRDCKRELHIDDWPMEYFTRAVNTLLTDYLATNGAKSFTVEDFYECVQVSGLYPEIESVA